LNRIIFDDISPNAKKREVRLFALPLVFYLCHSKNKPPALQVEGISSDKSNSCAKIDVGLQTTNKKAQEVQKWTITV
jgi:hypothetical protein